jgi:membrane-associated phospholipid phosphatase
MFSLSPLLELLLWLLLAVATLLGLGCLTVVGRDRLRRTRYEGPRRLREAAPYLGLLVAVLVVNKLVRDVVPEVSWLIDLNVTPAIYAIEGAVVADLQSVATPGLTAYFGFVYIIGYVTLLVFPFVAYLSLADLAPLRRTAIAYALNYSIGLGCYLLFVAYGPRNVVPDLVSPLLYQAYPTTQILTSEVNTNTNVFPSLHTSLSVTVAALAWQTRRTYPTWAVVAVVAAASVSLATMYLGIHWATDVVAGVVLGLFSVRVATWYTERDVVDHVPGTADPADD